MTSRYIRIAVITVFIALGVKYYWDSGYPPKGVEKQKSQRATELENAREEKAKAVLLKKPERIIAELCSPATNDCYQIKDFVKKDVDRILAKRRIDAKNNEVESWPIAHSYAMLTVPTKLTLDNIKTAAWPVTKSSVLFEYAQMMVGSGFITGALSFSGTVKQQALLIGLGGGTISNFFSVCDSFGPKIETTVVEIDPLFVAMAKKYFGHVDIPGVLNTVVDDGAKFIKQAKENNKKYSVVMLDAAYNTDPDGDGLIAPVRVFLNEEIAKDVFDIVEDDGVFTINILAVRERHFHEDSIFKLFSKYFPSCSLVEFRENQKMLICSKRKNFTWDEQKAEFRRNLQQVIEKFHFDHLRYVEKQ